MKLHLVALIICALFLGLNQNQIWADEIEDAGPPEPGQTQLTSSGSSSGSSPSSATGSSIPEPSQSQLTSQTESTIPEFRTSEERNSSSQPKSSGAGAGPPEPSTRPSFSSGAQNPGSSNQNQSPPEPSTRPSFSNSGAQNPGSSNQGPPEPSTRPSFSNSSPSSSSNPRSNSGPPEPSTRPHFSGSSQPDPARRPAYTRPYYVTSPPYVPPPQTRPHYNPRNDSRLRTSVPEPGQTGYYSQARSLPQIDAPPEPGSTYLARAGGDVRYHHLEDHKPLVTARLDRPFTQQVWRCDMAVNNCFLRNKHNFQPLVNVPFFARAARSMVLDVGDAARKWAELGSRRPNPVVAYNAARIETVNYFPAQYTDACLALSYYWSGERGRKYMHVLQRSQEDVCIYSAALDPADPNFRNAVGRWHDIQLQLDLRYGAAKFWIEWQFELGEREQQQAAQAGLPYTNFGEFGHIALRNFSIGYGTCQHNFAEECDVPR